MERIKIHNLAASGTFYGTAIATASKMRMNVQLYTDSLLEYELVRYILDKCYIYSAPHYNSMTEFGKPIYDKWTLHRIISEFRGILIYLLNNERTLYASFILLFLYYTGLLIITSALESEDFHSAKVQRDIEIIKLHMELINVKRLHLALWVTKSE